MNWKTINDDLAAELDAHRFSAPVSHVYQPLRYAREPYDAYCRRYGTGAPEILLVGMNPGPWGMGQTGVPFGDVPTVRDWLGVTAPVGQPKRPHPRRPVSGFECSRREVSGKRLWGWARELYTTPERFFERFFVANYCPSLFFDVDGRNLTPNVLKADDRAALQAACDRALQRTVHMLNPSFVLGVGRYAESRCQAALGDLDVTVGAIPHPSPANPQANKDWSGLTRAAFAKMHIELPDPA